MWSCEWQLVRELVTAVVLVWLDAWWSSYPSLMSVQSGITVTNTPGGAMIVTEHFMYDPTSSEAP